jgi:hypothetical protein
VLLTDEHVATAGGTPIRSEALRTGYTRDYSPVRLLGLPPGVDHGTVVDVLLERIDPTTGVLDARYVGDAAG